MKASAVFQGERIDALFDDVIYKARCGAVLVSLNNTRRQFAFSVTSEAVQTVIINGRIVMRERRILTID